MQPLRVSVTRRYASVYSLRSVAARRTSAAEWAWRKATPLKRSDVSSWMNKAVAEEREFTEAELLGLLDWLDAEFEAG